MTTDAALAIENVGFRYPGHDEWLLDIAGFALDRGEQMLLAGRSGMGKSTLLHLVLGLLEPGRGVVRVAGTDIHAIKGARRDHFRGAHIGMIFQTFHLLNGFTAIENVMAAMAFSDIPKAEHRNRARALLDRLDIARQDAMPDRLSVGQQQRVAVARALACDPELVLADEPTASLDPENAGGAMDLIQEICRERGAALLCVSHDPSLVERFGRHESLAELNRARTPQAGDAVGA
ncbi:MAG: ABC transporter ATP-binding protein [Phycisphaeraceae bacterium]|nr:MAG: ABC transporter ATP-binding protein [Phycisphaeraceae bacterium]